MNWGMLTAAVIVTAVAVLLPLTILTDSRTIDKIVYYVTIGFGTLIVFVVVIAFWLAAFGVIGD